MTAAQFDIDRVFVVNDAADARHGRINQLLLVDERALLQLVRQRARIGQERYVLQAKISASLTFKINK